MSYSFTNSNAAKFTFPPRGPVAIIDTKMMMLLKSLWESVSAN